VYKGLDIVTAKVTKEEQAQAVHHMIDINDPLKEYTVVDFRNKALSIMDSMIKSKKTPIIVGGTNYYIESLIWQTLVDNPKRAGGDDEDSGLDESLIKVRRIDGSSNEELHKKLMQVDPDMALRVHPNNRRKVIRSLEIFEQHGVTHSEILRQQRLAAGCSLGGPLRYDNSIIFWLTCEKEVLDKRIDARVDSMMDKGLVQELLDFHELYNKDRLKKNEEADYTKGIFQSIGFKEFHNYLILSKEERDDEKGEKLLQQSIEELKRATRKYARRQHKWVRNRLVRRADRQVPPLYSLDSTDVGQWESEVYGKAVDIVSAYLDGRAPSQPALNSVITDTRIADNSTETSQYCEVCQRIFIGAQWNEHLQGAKHMKAVRRRRRQEEANEYREAVEIEGKDERAASVEAEA
ncbi:tRNA dimethylallyltransferase, partial [Copidosoma floridanum]|uniref:tRNA dimethylallyltransferase n=1 Tax=Copidosoma floridanum TaxID=29053 RepID=UPI0006C9C8E7